MKDADEIKVVCPHNKGSLIMEIEITDILIAIICVYFGSLTVSSIFAATVNINNKCLDCNTVRRLDYAFPVKPIACWLAEEVK